MSKHALNRLFPSYDTPIHAFPSTYRFMNRTYYGKHVVDSLKEIRERFANLPETKLVVKPAKEFDRAISKLPTPYYTYAVGTWEVPPRLIERKERRMVNPNNVSASEYTDCTVTCKCGHWFATQEQGAKDNHNPDCNVAWFHQAWSDLWTKRRQITRVQLWYMHGSSLIATRLSRDEGRSLSNYMNDMGMTIRQLRDIGRYAAGKTAYEMHENFSYAEIAPAFGVQRQTLSSWANEYADVFLSESGNDNRTLDYNGVPMLQAKNSV